MSAVALAGSRAIPLQGVGLLVIDVMKHIQPRSTVLLRRGLHTEPGIFELMSADIARALGHKVVWCIPEEGGRETVFARDMEMVSLADVVICFIHVEQIGDETSGTVALADKAMRCDRPVYTYGVLPLEDATIIERVGEWDPKDEWSALVPAV